jgi:hypothetical protein
MLRHSIVIIHNPGPILICAPKAISLSKIFLLRLTLKVKIRAFSLAAYANSMAAMGRKAVGCRVVADPVIPERDIILVPLEPGVDLRRRGDEFIEERNDVITFGFGDADDFCDEARVEEKGFPAGYCGHSN